MKTDHNNWLSVTCVASYVFCPRKMYLNARHIQSRSNTYRAIGKIEHECRRKISSLLRSEYEKMMLNGGLQHFDETGLPTLIISQIKHERELARATDPLSFDAIDKELNNRIHGAIIEEETHLLKECRRLLSIGLPAREALDAVKPWQVEYWVDSPKMGLRGRVDQLWRRKDTFEPRDLKTCGPEVRHIFAESYWLQVALYGILIEEQDNVRVTNVGIDYTYDQTHETRELDASLRAQAQYALEKSREILTREDLPPTHKNRTLCTYCNYEEICHGGNNAKGTISENSPSQAIQVGDENDSSNEERIFYDFHKALYRFLCRRKRISKDDVKRFYKEKRQEIMSKSSESATYKSRARRFLKSLSGLAEKRLCNGVAPSVEAYFNGISVQYMKKSDWFYIVTRDRDVVPWVFTGKSFNFKADFRIADICLSAEHASGLACREAMCFNTNGCEERFEFGQTERERWGAVLVAENTDTNKTDPSQQEKTPDIVKPAPESNKDDGFLEKQDWLGKIYEDESHRLVFGKLEDKVQGLIFEKRCKEVKKGDLLVAEPRRPSSSDRTCRGKRIFCRVRKMESSPVHVVTPTIRFKELVTKIQLEPICQFDAEGERQPVLNDLLDNYRLRRADADETAEFLDLPKTGWPMGTLTEESGHVLANLPFQPEDAIFRSFFVVGAKGKGKTSFVRELVTILTGYRPQTSTPPAIVILDGEPKQPEDTQADEGASEFNLNRLQRAYDHLAEKIGGPQVLDCPPFREIRFSRESSCIDFKFGEINAVDLQLLLPPLPEKSADVLYRLLRNIDRRNDVELNCLADVLGHVRKETISNGQIDGRIAQAIGRALQSPSVEILENIRPDAVSVRDLVKPGTITVVNVTELDDQQRKVITLYLLLAFEQLAISRSSLNLLLVLDEAERLFPRKSSGRGGATTIKRVSARVADIARRGRRRRFGMAICTQYPADVDREIVGNCDIKVTYCLSGQDAWVRENLGKEFIGKVKQLDTGCGYIDLRKVSRASAPVSVRFFKA
ncbi:MAG: Dna2/Cas4 domain-containing protein [Pseudomonadota bacterium]